MTSQLLRRRLDRAGTIAGVLCAYLLAAAALVGLVLVPALYVLRVAGFQL